MLGIQYYLIILVRFYQKSMDLINATHFLLFLYWCNCNAIVVHVKAIRIIIGAFAFVLYHIKFNLVHALSYLEYGQREVCFI